MVVEIVVLRVLHFVTGVFWAGTAWFMIRFLAPTVRDTWPASAHLLRSLIERKFFVAIAVVGGINVLAGVRLMWIDSGGFSAAWLRSGPGVCYSIGGAAAIVALTIGGIAIRPAAMRVDTLLRAAEQTAETAGRESRLGEAKAAFGRFASVVGGVGALLGLAVVFMAVARYA